MSNPLKPEASLLCKIGSIVVHVEEVVSNKGHPFDVAALSGLLDDKEVKEWLEGMNKLAMLPVRR